MSSSPSGSRTPTKRLLTELTTYNSVPPSAHPFIISLLPSSSNILSLRCILSGLPLPQSTGYHNGRWLLSIQIPPTYPNTPPEIRFITRIVHPNVKFETGEICLDVLKEKWTPVLGLVGALESIGWLLGEGGLDSPLGVEVAALLREGDTIGARGLVGFWCGEERWEGGLEGEW